jgi:hypothetical protein
MVEQVARDDLFALDECRDSTERELTPLLNACAAPWVRVGVTLIGPFAETSDICKLVFYIDPPQGRLIRLEFFWNRYVLGYDETGQGGYHLNPRSPDVRSGFQGDAELSLVAAQIADRLDTMLRVGT